MVADVLDLQGEVVQFLLNIYSISNSSGTDNSSTTQILLQTMTLNSTVTSISVTRLLPDTLFMFSLTMMMYGGDSIACQPAYASTAKGGQPPLIYLFIPLCKHILLINENIELSSNLNFKLCPSLFIDKH